MITDCGRGLPLAERGRPLVVSCGGVGGGRTTVSLHLKWGDRPREGTAAAQRGINYIYNIVSFVGWVKTVET